LPDDMKSIFDYHKTEGGGYSEGVLTPGQLRCICDYVASMTNRYAIEFYARLKSENHQSIFKPF
jgi:dGTP triphosphohydrolase